MRKLFKLAAMAAAIFAASCSEEALEISVVPVPTEQGTERIFYASFDGDTKTSLSMNGAGTHADVLWNAGDEILIMGLKKEPLYLDGEYFITQDEGASIASFKCTVDWEPEGFDEYRAFYPPDLWPLYYVLSKIEAGGIDHTVSVPPVQHAVAGGLEKGLNMAVALNSSTDIDEFHFKNILSLVRFRLSGNGVNKISKIRLSSNVSLSGDGIYNIGTLSFEEGNYIPDAARYSGSRSYVELYGTFAAGEDYYMAVMPCTLAGFEMTFIDAEGKKIIKSSAKAVELQRSRITDFGTITIDDTFGDLPSDVEQYMTHTKGSKPVCIAVLGDAFTATEQDKFKAAAHEAVDALFSTEPYKTYKDYFNVYIMQAVSNESGASITDGNGNVVTPHDTYFGACWGENTYGDMTCKNDRVFNYVSGHCPEILNGELTVNEVPVLLIVNDNRFGGRCTTWDNGCALSIVPTTHRESGEKLMWTFPDIVAASNESPDAGTRNLSQEERDAIVSPYFGSWLNIAVHEFGGHGFGRLGDEYWYNPIRGEGEIESHSWRIPFKLNVASSYDNVPWQPEVLDVLGGGSSVTVNPDNISYYSSRVGRFQGGLLYALGRWRSEFVSCMIDNRFYFSLWQRMLIVKRIMSLAGETFDLQEFYNNDVPYDPARDSQASSAPAQIARKAGKGVTVHEVPMLLPPREIHN